jgi:hypothetical protein
VRVAPALNTDIDDVVCFGKWSGFLTSCAAASASEPRWCPEWGCRPRGESYIPLPRGESSLSIIVRRSVSARERLGVVRGVGDAALSDSDTERCTCAGRGESKLSSIREVSRRWWCRWRSAN